MYGLGPGTQRKQIGWIFPDTFCAHCNKRFSGIDQSTNKAFMRLENDENMEDLLQRIKTEVSLKKVICTLYSAHLELHEIYISSKDVWMCLSCAFRYSDLYFEFEENNSYAHPESSLTKMFQCTRPMAAKDIYQELVTFRQLFSRVEKSREQRNINKKSKSSKSNGLTIPKFKIGSNKKPVIIKYRKTKRSSKSENNQPAVAADEPVVKKPIAPRNQSPFYSNEAHFSGAPPPVPHCSSSGYSNRFSPTPHFLCNDVAETNNSSEVQNEKGSTVAAGNERGAKYGEFPYSLRRGSGSDAELTADIVMPMDDGGSTQSQVFGHSKLTVLKQEDGWNFLDKWTCTFCHQRFQSSRDRNNHIKMTHAVELRNGSLQCTSCHKVLKNMINFRRHGTVHSSEFRSNCPFCAKTFKHPISIRRHCEIEHNSMEVNPCFVDYMEKVEKKPVVDAELLNQRENANDNISNIFRDSIAATPSHNSMVNHSETPLDLSNFLTMSERHPLSELATVNNDEIACKVEENKPALGILTKPQRRRRKKQIFGADLEDETNMERTESTIKKAKNFISLNKPVVKAQGEPTEYLCGFCNTKFSELETRRAHIKAFHGTELPDKRILCRLCGLICSTPYHLHRHASVHVKFVNGYPATFDQHFKKHDKEHLNLIAKAAAMKNN